MKKLGKKDDEKDIKDNKAGENTEMTTLPYLELTPPRYKKVKKEIM